MSKQREALEAALRAAMKKAFNFGQTYWQQADSHFVSQQDKSDITREEFNKLVNDTVRSTLAEPEQEPVMIYRGRHTIDCGEFGSHDMEMLKLIPAGTKLYTSPQPREWQELSAQEIEKICSIGAVSALADGRVIRRAIEYRDDIKSARLTGVRQASAALRAKNGG